MTVVVADAVWMLDISKNVGQATEPEQGLGRRSKASSAGHCRANLSLLVVVDEPS
jgi:hypothetical protein